MRSQMYNKALVGKAQSESPSPSLSNRSVNYFILQCDRLLCMPLTLFIIGSVMFS